MSLLPALGLLGCVLVLARRLRRPWTARVARAFRAQVPAASLAVVREGLPGAPVAVVVHGTFCSGESMAGFARRLGEEGFRVLGLEYPYCEDPAANAAELGRMVAGALRPADRVRAVVGYSQGGLLLRDLLTRADRPGWTREVETLVAIGSPDAGTPVAVLNRLAEPRPGGVPRFPALEALVPGSAYLEEVTRRPLPEDLRVGVVVGRGRGAALLARILRGQPRPGPFLRGLGAVYEALFLGGPTGHDGLVPEASALGILAAPGGARGPAPRVLETDHIGLLFEPLAHETVARWVAAHPDRPDRAPGR